MAKLTDLTIREQRVPTPLLDQRSNTLKRTHLAISSKLGTIFFLQKRSHSSLFKKRQRVCNQKKYFDIYVES